MARILLCTFGSYGDLYPYLALGTELRNRGHAVTVATSPCYAAKVGACSLAFHPVRPDVSLDDRALLAYVMDAKRGSERLLRYLASVIGESYRDTLPAAQETDLIVTHPVTFAAVLAARKLQLPWVSTELAPISFLSAYDPPVLAAAPWLHPFSRLGPSFARLWITASRPPTAAWLRPLLDFRRDLGIENGGHPLFEGQHSPSLVLALFSRCLAEPQPDWPPQTLVTGFPFYDTGEAPPELDHFLRAGPAPIVFTLGSSAVGAAGDFYRHSFEAARRMHARAVFLAGSHPQGLPENLPASMIAVDYAPHSSVFPYASVVVHQGGVGTTAQAVRAGHPMLVVPFAHDQFDNGERVRRQGAGAVLPHTRYTAARAEQWLRRLREQTGYSAAAQKLAAIVRSESGTRTACDAIENVLRSGTHSASN